MIKLIKTSQNKALSVNGNALVYEDGSVPAGYRRLTGIVFDGGVHYETPFRLRGSDTLRFSYRASVAGNVIGCYSGNASKANFSYYHAASAYMRHGTTLARPNVSSDTRYDIVAGPTGATGFPSSVTWQEATFEVEGDFYIGMLANSSSAHLTGVIYDEISIDGRACFVPVERISDGAILYYERKSGSFYENEGPGTPAALGYV